MCFDLANTVISLFDTLSVERSSLGQYNEHKVSELLVYQSDYQLAII
jgi:hypothetical protein